MQGLSLIEAIVSMIILSIVLTTAGVLMNSVYRNSILAYDRITVQDELFKIDAAIRGELLKAGPTIQNLNVTPTSIEFYAIVPFSKPLYGNYASSTRLLYRISFSNGKLELQVSDEAGYTKRVLLGEVQNCVFSRDTHRPNLIRYSLTKKNITRTFEFSSCVLLYNLK